MASPAMDFSRAVIANLAANDVRDIVLCPGSRSGPLAHALAEAAEGIIPGAPRIRLHVRIDERAAGFLALGLAMANGASAVVTTSGTAAGNLLPAIMEAHHSGVRLFAITADRPFDLRATGANQTTDQRTILAPFVRLARDVIAPGQGRDLDAEASALVCEAIARSVGARSVSAHSISAAPAHPGLGTGPVHLNLQFAEPLGPDRGPWPAALAADLTFEPEASVPPLPELERGIVVAGDRAGPAAATIAASRGWPLLAEPTSGARAGATVVPGYAALLATDKGEALIEETEFVLLIGRATLSRGVRALVDGATALWVARHGSPWREAPVKAEVVIPDVPFDWIRAEGVPTEGRAWLARWLALAAEPEIVTWGIEAIASTVLASVGESPLVVGSSRAIRAVDAVLPGMLTRDRRMIFANRGLAGIDGTLSTASGLALGLDAPVTALVGDLTFLHDAGGLLVGPLERRPSLRIVVVNDNGGGIFSGIEHAGADPDAFARVFTTPHGIDLGAVANAYGASHARVGDVEALRRVLANPPVGVEVIEATLP
jgi:2-succinyl-5-enolpyruvyl-6-hydroxy-3-cyclohexene-1-carboxylate synthase